MPLDFPKALNAKMTSEVRKAFYLGLVVSILLTFVQAPFLHIHAGNASHDHAHGFVHMHWSADHTGGGTVEADDHESDARSLNWVPGNGESSVRFVAILSEAVVLPELISQPSLIPDLVPHNHDPPWRFALKSRAPPA